MFFLIYFACFSQTPKISYIIPDIGTPNFGVYVEIIGPHDAFGNFGDDQFYPDNNGNVRIVFDRPEDTAKIVVGPIYVSWSGRMISTYFFVKPTVNTPNTSDWRYLDNQFRIPIRVQVGSNISNSDTFYIVRPYSFGNLVQSNQIFGANPLGIRSPSGAMIVDNLSLAGNTYKAFLDNSVPFPQSNRTYLPFTLLVLEKITGVGISTKISVDAGEGAIQNGGPGGGGGGGRFCDYLTGNPGEDGGRGFVSGGRGGTNNLMGGGSYKSLSTGTGDSGKSTNGILPPAIPYAWEASGGGTGHPFGKSGIGSGNQSDWNYLGGYGGGTGSINNRMGGSGGFATSGANEPSNYRNGGKVHGNRMIVPIAGGSGGASGNPNGLNVCAGSGGGGGGAIRIFAKSVENLSISADGRNGGQSSYGAGGGGSGGSVGVFTKLSASFLNLSARGGNGGGVGYIRVDAPVLSNVTFSHSNPEPYRGLTTDTSSYVIKKFVLRGSKSSSTDSVILFLKPESGNWTILETMSGLRGTIQWQKEITLIGKDSLYFLCAIEDLGSSIVDSFAYVPRYVYSQSAMNILYKPKFPEIAGSRFIRLKIRRCPGNEITDSVPITNIGTAPLLLYFDNAQFRNGNGFRLVQPTSVFSLLPDDTVWVKFKFVVETNTPTIVIDTLIIPHNDQFSDFNPWLVEVKVELEDYSFQAYSINKLELDTINLGVYCLDFTSDTNLILKNSSNFPAEISFEFEANKYDLAPNGKLFQTGEETTINLKINNLGSKYGWNIDSIIYYPTDCPYYKKKLFIKYFNTRVDFAFYDDKSKKIDTLNLGDVCVGNEIRKEFFVKNSSNFSAKILQKSTSGSNVFVFYFSNKTQLQVDDTTFNYVLFRSDSVGIFRSRIVYLFDLCDYIDTLYVEGRAIQPNLLVVGGNFGMVPIGDEDTIVVFVTNNGDATVYIEQIDIVLPPFGFIGSNPELPTYLRKGDTLKLYFTFKPQQDGQFENVVKATGRGNLPNICDVDLEIRLFGIGTYGKIVTNVDSVYMGVFPYCKSKDTTIYIENRGQTTLKINRVYIEESNVPPHFSISNLPSFNIPPGAIDSLVVKFEGIRGATAGWKTAELIIESTDLQNPRLVIHLSAFQENLNVEIVPSELDFGVVQIGDSKKLSVSLTNLGSLQQRISNIYGKTGDFIAIPTSLVLIPNIEVSFEVEFAPKTEGWIYDTLMIIYYIPCPDTQYIVVRGRGVSGDFAYPDKLDFGEVGICDIDTIQFDITNLGTIPFRLDSARIVGTDSIYFFLDHRFIIIVDSAVKLRLIFYPGGGKKSYNATLVIYAFINNATREVRIPVTASRVRKVDFVPSEYDFGICCLGLVYQSRDSAIVIKNNDNKFARIESISSSNNSFQVITPTAPQVVMANDRAFVLIQYVPKDLGMQTDTIKVALIFDVAGRQCYDTIALLVKGFGYKDVNYFVRVPDLVFNPKQNSASIPILIQPVVASGDSLVYPAHIDSVAVSVSFRWNIFHFISATNGKVVSDLIQGEKRILTLLFDTVRIENSNQRVLTELRGIPLLGDSSLVVVQLEKIMNYSFCAKSWVQDSVNFENGSIRTIVCTEGGERLLKLSQTNLLISTYDDFISIRFSHSINGLLRISLINTLGQTIVTNQYETEKWFDEVKISIPAWLAQGVYFLKIELTEGLITIPIIR